METCFVLERFEGDFYVGCGLVDFFPLFAEVLEYCY